MILAVNIGNTNIRAAIGREHISANAIIPVGEISVTQSFADCIEQRFGISIWSELEGSIVASVFPELTPVITESIKEKTGIAPQRIYTARLELNTQRYTGILGEDRAVCCDGALRRCQPPFIVIDFGTATTINVVDENGEFRGGAILAGVRMGMSALAGKTALLPSTDSIDADIPLIGKNTIENIRVGAVVGAACAMEGYVRRVEREMGRVLPVIVTGGNASAVLPYCEINIIHEPNLLLESLFAIYTLNKGIV